jgi:hypothetical protein
MAATVTELQTRRGDCGATGGVTVRASIDAFLDSPKIKDNSNTLRAYTNVLDRISEQLGPDRALAGAQDDEIGETLTTLADRSALPAPRRAAAGEDAVADALRIRLPRQRGARTQHCCPD